MTQKQCGNDEGIAEDCGAGNAMQEPGTAAWQEWIGSSPWRTLIAYEGWALQRDRKKVGAGNTPPSGYVYAVSDLDSIPNERSQHLSVGRVMPGCALAFLAGRPYVVGAPEGANERLSYLFGDSERANDLNLVLLSWDKAHVEGLADLYIHENGLRPKTIWTSEWIYDRLRDGSSTTLHDVLTSARIIRYDDSGNPQIEDPSSATGDITVVLFDHGLEVSYLPQVSLSLAYNVADSPTLYLQLRLYDTTLNIHRRGVDSVSSLDKYSSDILNHIWNEYPQARTALAKSAERRLKELAERTMAVCARAFTYIVDTVEFDSRGEPVQQANLLPTQLGATCDPMDSTDCGSDADCAERNRIKVGKCLKMRVPFEVGRLETIEGGALPPDLQQNIVLAIGCGGLSTRSHGLITPTRRVLIRKSLDVSLLGLKFLEYLDTCHHHPGLFSSELVVFVSPWTVSAVREEMSRLSWEFHDSLPAGFKITYAEQQSIIPRHAENGKEFFRQEDGGFQYNTSGHYDLALWLVAHHKKLGDARFVYYTNYNNLGRNIDANVARLAHVLSSRDAVALFELTPHFVGREAIDQGSYWVSADNGRGKGAGRLVKPVYFGIQGRSDEWKDARDQLFRDRCTPPDLHMSTGSVLFDLPKLRTCPQAGRRALSKMPFYARHRPPLPSLVPGFFPGQQASSSDGAIQFERDLDQITWIRDCIGARVESRRCRFFPIKKEEDLAREKFRRLRALYRNVKVSGMGKQKELPPADRPVALIPAEQHDPWGGYLIHAEKELPFGEEPVSETWEASLHDRGVSGVVYNAIHSIPLARFAKAGEHESELDVMVKLLDCHDWLSLQVHPGDGIIHDIINHESADGRRAICADRIVDERGKEETFVVLREPEEGAGFYLGLEAERVRGCSGIDVLPSSPSAIEPSRVVQSSPLRILSGLLGIGSDADLPAGLGELYAESFRCGVKRSLSSILSIRGDARITVPVLDGIVLFLAFDSLRESFRHLSTSGMAGMEDFIRGVYNESGSGLLRYFHRVDDLKIGQVITVPPGFVHAAGPGLHLIELSHRSDNTFRILDHGREVSDNPRLTHCALAATVLSAECLVDRRTVQRYVKPAGSRCASRGLRFQVLEGNTLQPKSITESATHDGSDAGSVQERAAADRFGTEGGQVVLCTRGRVRLRTRYAANPAATSKAAADSDLTLWPAHAAYVPPAGPGRSCHLSVETVGHHESACVVVDSRSVQGSPALCISIGGTQVEIAYEDYINGRRHETFLWHEVLKQPWGHDWSARHDALGGKVREFTERYCETLVNSPVHVGIIWSGMLQGSDPSWQLRSRVIGYCQMFQPKEFFARHSALPNLGKIDCLFDARADVMAEVADVLGHLRDIDSQPMDGMILNIASGVCIGIHRARESSFDDRYPYRLNSGGREVDLAHFGRIMWCDTATGSWHLVKDTGDANAERDEDFIGHIREMAAAQAGVDASRLVRASDLLSTTAIVLRYLGRRHHRLGSSGVPGAWVGRCPDISAMLEDLGHDRAPAERIEAYTNALAEYRPVLNAIADSVIRRLNEQAYGSDSAEGRFAYEFVRTIAYDLADMLVALVRQCPEVTPYLSRTVLSGYGGANFGVGSENSSRMGFLRILCDHVLCQLRCREVDRLEIRRTETFSNPYRLLDIFHDKWASEAD